MAMKLLNDSLLFPDFNRTLPDASRNKRYDVDPSDAVWILTSAFLIFAMQSGFGLLESGVVSRKNETNIMVKNVVDVLYGGLAYWLFGFAVSFGQSKYSNPFCGVGYFLVHTDNSNEEGWLDAKYFFQLSFATTATTIVSGAMAERVYLKAYTVFAFFHVFSYCFPAHWVWDEHTGWLYKMGFIDVAGASVVHVVGGVSGCVATMMLKPRHKRFAADGAAKPMEISSPTNVVLGTFMLWWGWLGFNCGSTFGISNEKWKLAARSAVCTLNASVGGGCFAVVYSYIFKRNSLNIPTLATGIISGLVSITGICAITRPWEALLIGFIGSMIGCLGCRFVERLAIDDPVHCVPTHAFAGTWAIIAVSLFAEKDNILEKNANHHGILKGGSIKFLGIQVFGVTVIVCWAIATSYASLYVIDRFMGLRVSLLEEIIGADRIEHGIADINDPEGVLQIRRLLPGGAKIRLAKTRQRVFSLKQPRHRNVYSFAAPNAKANGASVSNGNSSLASRDHVFTLRKRFRQAQDQSLPTTKRARYHNSFEAREHSDSSVMDNYVVTVDTHEGSVSDSNHETLSISQGYILMSNDSTLEESPRQTFEDLTRLSSSLLY